MYSHHLNQDHTLQKSGVVLLFKPKHTQEQPQACIFCGETLHLQTFKGKIVCSDCLQDIPAIFVCG
ncbi:hypothetical protein [Desulfitobacterium sp.]|uniref:hypothetical protein n=1 Tax=Desulfitobacterium sp. TaxID=49981 RepID=UPI002B20936D|nr:hypothetical protein [Desulfitobacterium sp.]MEA4900872.1 hypothetical protein [Desulfitobacterium sp.]